MTRRVSAAVPAPSRGFVLAGRCATCGLWLESRTGGKRGCREVDEARRGPGQHQHRKPWTLVPATEWATHQAEVAVEQAATRLARDTRLAYDPTHHWGPERAAAG